MASIAQEVPYAESRDTTGEAVASAAWGNAAPLALAAFAVTTFMLSMVNASWVNSGVEPVVFGVALMFGGITQLVAGTIEFRNGNTFAGVLFSTYGAFWMSLFAIAEYFLGGVPAGQVGHALGLYLFAFGIFTFWMWIASFRTNAIVVAALFVLLLTFIMLGLGNYYADTTLVHTGGYLGLITAGLAGYLSCAEVCQASYGRTVLPVWPLSGQ